MENLVLAIYRHGICMEITQCCVLICIAIYLLGLDATAALALRLFRFETADVRWEQQVYDTGISNDHFETTIISIPDMVEADA